MDYQVNYLHNMIDSDGLTLLHGGHTPRCVANVDKAFTYHTVQLMTAGGVEVWYDQTQVLMRGAWLWTTWPGSHVRFHEFPKGKPWHHRYIAYEGPVAAAWKAQGLLPDHPLQLTDGPGVTRLTLIFDDLLEQSVRQDAWGRRRAVNMLERLLIEVMDMCRPINALPSPWLRDVMHALCRWDREPDYAQLAAQAGMSLSTLRRNFREATGVAIHTYRLQSRIASARQLLGETDAPIKRIAEKLGYRDLFYFTRQFTQYAGVSPAKYRATRQA